MKVEIFEITADYTPVIFASEAHAAAAAAALSRGMVARCGNGHLLYVPCEPTVRRVVIDMPKKASQLLGATRRPQLAAAQKGGAELSNRQTVQPSNGEGTDL